MLDAVHELIGVYDADGTLLGEARYWIGARLGRTHCALCDITHGLFTQRADWRRCRDQLDVEFRTYHRNDAPADVLAVGAPAPFVVARTDRGLVALLGPQELDACAGDVDQFHQALTEHAPNTNSTASKASARPPTWRSPTRPARSKRRCGSSSSRSALPEAPGRSGC